MKSPLQSDLAAARLPLASAQFLSHLSALPDPPLLSDFRAWLSHLSASLQSGGLLSERPAEFLSGFSPFSLGCFPAGDSVYERLQPERVQRHMLEFMDDRFRQIADRRVRNLRLAAFPDPLEMGRYVSPPEHRVWPEWIPFEESVLEWSEDDLWQLEVSASLSLPFTGRVFCFSPAQFPGRLTPWPFEMMLRSMDLLPGDQLVRWLQNFSTRISWWIPSQDALDALIRWSGGQLVELGAGSGLAARLLRDRAAVTGQSLSLRALDDYSWIHSTSLPWTDVERGSAEDLHGAQTPLLIAWPPLDGQLLRGALDHWRGASLALVIDLQVDQPYDMLDRLAAEFVLIGSQPLPSADCGLQVLTFWERLQG